MKALKGLPVLFVAALLAFAVSLDANAVDARQQWISATVNVADLADGAGASQSITMAGAALGDVCAASISVSTVGLTVTCNVTAANTVIVRVQNETTGSVDLASATFRVLLFKKPV